MPSGRRKSTKPTMQEIADQLGISKVSVSKALNDKPGISDELRRTIQAAARNVGYSKHPMEGTPGHKYAFVVSKHFFLETDSFYSEMYYQFNKLCAEIGCTTVLVVVGNTDETQHRLPAQLMMEEVDGIAVGGEMSDDYLLVLKALNRPMVLLDFESKRLGLDAILTDNYYWGCQATQYLIDLGHKKIGFVGQPGATSSITDRYFGYRRTLMLNHLPFDENWVLVNNDQESGLYQSNIVLPDDMPTALVCHCDMAARYLIETLTMAHLSCPDDVSIVSFDNTRLAELVQPKLSSINIDIRTFARQAVEFLSDAVEHPAKSSKRIYLPAALVVRDSAQQAK